MNDLKFSLTLFMVLFMFSCGKDKPVTPENELEFPLSFNIDHYDLDGDTKFYVAGENDTYSEVSASNAYKASFEDEIVENTNEILTFFELRKLVLKSATELVATYEYVNPNTLEVEGDTVVSFGITITGNKIEGDSIQTFFLSNQNENLLLPHSVYGSFSYAFDYVDNLDRDFTAIADHAVKNVALQDTFGVKFLDLVYKKE